MRLDAVEGHRELADLVIIGLKSGHLALEPGHPRRGAHERAVERRDDEAPSRRSATENATTARRAQIGTRRVCDCVAPSRWMTTVTAREPALIPRTGCPESVRAAARDRRWSSS